MTHALKARGDPKWVAKDILKKLTLKDALRYKDVEDHKTKSTPNNEKEQMQSKLPVFKGTLSTFWGYHYIGVPNL